MPSSSTIQKDESEVKSLLPSGERSENVEHTNNSTSASVTIAESTHHAKHSLIDEPVMSTPLTVGLTLGMLFGGKFAPACKKYIIDFKLKFFFNKRQICLVINHRFCICVADLRNRLLCEGNGNNFLCWCGKQSIF